MTRNIEESFYVLVKRIQRLTPKILLDNGYASKRQIKTHYGNKHENQNISFEYLKIKTNEGAQGVLHILYFGDFLPQKWIKDNWYNITGESKSVYIRACKKQIYNENNLARYCIAQYCISQSKNEGDSSYIRYSWSHSWVYTGFVEDWEQAKKIHKDIDKNRLYKYWREWLQFKQNDYNIFEVPLEDFQ
jgi:hypothetical protein